MADISDVTNGLVDIITSALYPDGSEDPSAVGFGIKIYEGWPSPDALDKDIARRVAHVSVYPRPEELDTTRGLRQWTETEVEGDEGTALKIVGQQEQLIQIAVWAATPADRVAIAKIIDPKLKDTARFALPDGTMAMPKYRNSITDDFTQKAAIFRKNLFYYVEYATTVGITEGVIKKTTVGVENGYNDTVAIINP